MLSKKIIAYTVSVFMILVTTSSAFACACCVERGHYGRSRVKLDKFHAELLNQIKINGTADLYMTAAGFDGIKGCRRSRSLILAGLRQCFKSLPHLIDGTGAFP
jgi:hypothetical protein